MSQLSLFSAGPDRATSQVDADSERLLDRFLRERLAEGAHPRSARREVSQLRSMMREAGGGITAVPLGALFAAPDLIARALTEPTADISRSTGRARLVAVQRFIRLMARRLGRGPASDLAALDARLPARRVGGWHTTGTLVGGVPGRRRPRGPTLDAADLHRIVDAAGERGGPPAGRDRALVALLCFSGVRPEEAVRLSWEDLAVELSAAGRYGLTATVTRRGERVTLILPEPAACPIHDLARTSGGTVQSLAGPLFCARGMPSRPLSYRAARDVLRNACREAGLPAADGAALRAACAHWLRAQGLSDHEVASVLGLARVRSVDRLLRHHAALNAQRAVKSVLAR